MIDNISFFLFSLPQKDLNKENDNYNTNEDSCSMSL